VVVFRSSSGTALTDIGENEKTISVLKHGRCRDHREIIIDYEGNGEKQWINLNR
jgi:hypothetical protein